MFDIAIYGKTVRCSFNSFEQWTMPHLTSFMCTTVHKIKSISDFATEMMLQSSPFIFYGIIFNNYCLHSIELHNIIGKDLKKRLNY